MNFQFFDETVPPSLPDLSYVKRLQRRLICTGVLAGAAVLTAGLTCFIWGFNFGKATNPTFVEREVRVEKCQSGNSKD